MNFSQITRLVFISAIWGGSHVLIRITVPEIGPLLTAFLRILIAAVTLCIYQSYKGQAFNFKKSWRFYLLVGVLYTALPLSLFAFASVYLPAAYLVILNAAAPIFTALFSWMILGESFDRKKIASLMIGMTGVYLLKEYGSIERVTGSVLLAMLMALGAAASYGLCGVLVKKYGNGGNSVALTTGSNIFAVAMLLPFAIPTAVSLPTPQFLQHSLTSVLLALLVLGSFGSAFAFVTFYKLIEEIGPFRASLSAFLMPIFGIIWGILLLGESVSQGMVLGAALVILSTALFIKRPAPVSR